MPGEPGADPTRPSARVRVDVVRAGQPGLASGGLNLAEAVRQLFGEGGARQVKDPKNALVTGIGVIPYGRNWGTSAAMILEV